MSFDKDSSRILQGNMLNTIKREKRRKKVKKIFNIPSPIRVGIRAGIIVACGYFAKCEIENSRRLSVEDFDGPDIEWVREYNYGRLDDEFKDSGLPRNEENRALYDSLVTARNNSLEGEIYVPVKRK
jgi:hypothetical protein